jgi:hypothetical protein
MCPTEEVTASVAVLTLEHPLKPVIEITRTRPVRMIVSMSVE